MTRELLLTRGQVALIDDEDFDRVNEFNWTVLRSYNTWYVRRTLHLPDRQVAIYLHRFLLEPPPGFQIDHRNGNGLDNRRSNLRLCSAAENMRNRPPVATNKTGFKGVRRPADYRRWMAQITIGGKIQKLGLFDTPEEAAKAYDEFARRVWGDFARLNFPDATTSGQASLGSTR